MPTGTIDIVGVPQIIDNRENYRYRRHNISICCFKFDIYQEKSKCVISATLHLNTGGTLHKWLSLFRASFTKQSLTGTPDVN